MSTLTFQTHLHLGLAVVVTGLLLGGVYKCLFTADRTSAADPSDMPVHVQPGEVVNLLGLLSRTWLKGS